MRMLDGFNSGLLTFNKILWAGNEFGSVVGNIKLDDIRTGIEKRTNLDKIKTTENIIQKDSEENKRNIIEKVERPLNEKIEIKSEHKEEAKTFDDITEKINQTHKIEDLLKSIPKSEKLTNPQEIKKVDNNKVENSSNPKIQSDQITNEVTEEEKSNEKFLIKSDKVKFNPKESRIPVSSLSRAMNFGMLGASIIGNTMSQVFKDKVI